MAASLAASGISLRSLSRVSFNTVHEFSRNFDRKSFVPLLPHYSHSSSYRAHIQSSNKASLQTINNDSSAHHDPDKWTIKMLYDGDCPLCMREVNMLRERNMRYGTIKFIDISSNNYRAEENAGIDFAAAMGRIHAILQDGTVLTDIKAFKRLYEEVGLGWVYAFTKIEMVAKIADFVYDLWAKNRLPITGRPPMAQILKEREEKVW